MNFLIFAVRFEKTQWQEENPGQLGKEETEQKNGFRGIFILSFCSDCWWYYCYSFCHESFFSFLILIIFLMQVLMSW